MSTETTGANFGTRDVFVYLGLALMATGAGALWRWPAALMVGGAGLWYLALWRRTR